MTLLRTGLLSAVVSALSLVGCESKDAHMSHSDRHSMDHSGSAMGSDNAVMCDKCMTTWVRKPVSAGAPGPHGQTAIAYRNVKSAETCPDCDKAAQEYMSTGKLGHCNMCKDDLKVVKPNG